MDSISIVRELAIREHTRDDYWLRKDPIADERLLWRAQTFRHLVHLLPGQSVLELGSGTGLFTHKLRQATRGENPITAITFAEGPAGNETADPALHRISYAQLQQAQPAPEFDFVVVIDLLDEANCAWVLRQAYAYLKTGGQVVFYENNPWNPFFRLNNAVFKHSGGASYRKLYSRQQLHRLIKAAGFSNTFSAFHDFAYAPLAGNGKWLLQNLSIILENMPVVQNIASSILVHAQKGAIKPYLPASSLFEHPQLHRAVSVVVPCHNEEMNIGPLVSRLMDLYSSYIHEIVLVDDNSRDSTREVIAELAEAYPVIKPVFRTPPNGVGRAITDGYRAATGQYVLSIDCDFRELLPELRDIFDGAAEGYGVVIGSRFSRYSVLLNYPFQKIVANRGFHVLARLMLNTKFRDVTNNLKLFRREVVDAMPLTQPGFSINAETGLLPLVMNYSVKEVPMSWINRTAEMGVSSFRLAKVGGGYWQVLYRLWLTTVFKSKKYYPSLHLQPEKKYAE
ncbi:glycosyltransferase [Hymenobacter daeguensis]